MQHWHVVVKTRFVTILYLVEKKILQVILKVWIGLDMLLTKLLQKQCWKYFWKYGIVVNNQLLHKNPMLTAQHQPGIKNNKATSHMQGEGDGGGPTEKMFEKKKDNGKNGHTEISAHFLLIEKMYRLKKN